MGTKKGGKILIRRQTVRPWRISQEGSKNERFINKTAFSLLQQDKTIKYERKHQNVKGNN